MDKRDLSNLGDEIKDIVQNAVSTMDFHQLNRDIGNTVNNALDEVKKTMRLNQSDRSNWNYRPNPQPRHNNPNEIKNQMQRRNVSSPKVTNFNVPVGRISGILFTIFGNIGIGVLGIAVLVLSIIGEFTGGSVFGMIVLGLLPLLVGSVFLAARGGRIRRRVKRFNQYLALFRNRNYCLIKELSSHIGLSEKYVVKDLRKMITIGMFPEGHIDEQKTCFMLNHECYDQYLKLQDNMRAKHLEEQEIQKKQDSQKKEEAGQKKVNTVGNEFKNSIDEGKLYIKQIKEANDAIAGEEISQKLYRLEMVTSKIFQYVELHPEQLSEIQKFMEYYLPTTLKLLNAYKEFDYQSVQGENISTAKKEIEITLDTINLAFENLLDSLFEDAAMDISTDISVLQTMLAQEGLTEKDFNSNR